MRFIKIILIILISQIIRNMGIILTVFILNIMRIMKKMKQFFIRFSIIFFSILCSIFIIRNSFLRSIVSINYIFFLPCLKLKNKSLLIFIIVIVYPRCCLKVWKYISVLTIFLVRFVVLLIEIFANVIFVLISKSFVTW